MAASPDVLLLHAMLLVAGADGEITASEQGLLEGHFASVPEFSGKDFRTVFHQATTILREFSSRQSSVAALAALTGHAATKAYWLAVDMALASGSTHATLKMLSEISETLGLEDQLATQIREVITLKYI